MDRSVGCSFRTSYPRGYYFSFVRGTIQHTQTHTHNQMKVSTHLHRCSINVVTAGLASRSWSVPVVVIILLFTVEKEVVQELHNPRLEASHIGTHVVVVIIIIVNSIILTARCRAAC